MSRFTLNEGNKQSIGESRCSECYRSVSASANLHLLAYAGLYVFCQLDSAGIHALLFASIYSAYIK
jgi:hypothetical protein